EAILSAAKEHAASIRQTLWLREYKLKHGRPAPVLGPLNPGRKSHGRDRESWVIKGHIYSPEYWRAWRNRCRSTKSRSRRPRATTQLRAESATARSLHVSSRNPVSTGIRLASSIPSPPSSSFAGGRPAKNIFAVPDTSALLRHHDAIVRPPLEGFPSEAVRVTTCNGVRFSQSNPRSSLGICQRAPERRCDIERADRWVKPTAISYSFGTGRSTGTESPFRGISMENPGAIYNPIIRSPVRTIRLTPGDRFRSNASAFGTPGPGAYTPKYDGVRYRVPGAVLWTRPETVMDHGWCKPASSWKGFGYGCSMKEHIDYGACLDGRCCMRHSIERKNASWVVQSQGQGCDRTRHLPSTRTRSSDGGQRATRAETEGRKEAVALCSYGSDGSQSLHPRSGHPISVSRRAVNTARLDQFGRKRAPLHFASERNEVSVVDRLCRQGDDINAVDERGQTPLHIAAEKGNTRVVERLLREKEQQDEELEGNPTLTATEHPHRGGTAIVNVQDDNGRTPLYLGCLHGHERVVLALLMAGADPAMIDAQGKSPQAKQQNIYQLLQFKADIPLAEASIATLEESGRPTERRIREADFARDCLDLVRVKWEERRLIAAVKALKEERAVYAAA
ncbi:unnamed protein product, partial [Ascophyllum nodosum]